MDCIQFEINQIPCGILRLDKGYMLLVKNQEKMILNSHEIYMWLTGSIELSYDLSISKSLIHKPQINCVLKFVGIESTRYI